MIILAWMDDWQMSARLAKLSTVNSYELIFCEKSLQFPNLKTQRILIVDMDSLEEEDLEKVAHLGQDELTFIIGYAREMDGAQIKYLRKLGCDMVLRRNKLLKNLNTLLKKVINAD